MAQLAVRAGEPPSGVEVLARAQQMERFQLLDEMWVAVAAVVRRGRGDAHVARRARASSARRSRTGRGSPPPARCSTPRRCGSPAVDLPFDPQAGFCVRGGVFALRAVAAYFGLPFDPDPAQTDPDQHQRGRVPRGVRPARRRGHPDPRRPRAGVARLQRLARELRPGADRPRRPRHGAVRALVVGPLAAVPPRRTLRAPSNGDV